MIKIEKIVLLFVIVLLLFVGVVSATENLQEDQSYTNDETVASDAITVSQDNNKILNNEENKLLDENPQKKIEYTTHNIEKKTKDTNLKQDGIIEVHNYTELKNAVNNARSTGVDTTIRLLQGSYNNTETITWNTGGMVLTIDGNGQTINGQQQQVFDIRSGASLVLKNIIITNATSSDGGAISNVQGSTLTVSNSTFNNNRATIDGGAIYNVDGKLTVTHSTFTNNQATDKGGAIFDNSNNELTNITSSTFINNTAPDGAAIKAYGWINLTNNTFNKNIATNNKETIDLNGWWNGIHEDNIYESTDINLTAITISTKDNQNTFCPGEEVTLNYSIQLANPMHYKDFETGINDITLYINSQKNITTKYENYTLTGLEPGEYEVYYTTCNQQSNTVTFKVIGDAEVNVTNYTQLVQAIENATNEEYNIYKINLQPGDYNATTSINWENSATKKIIINGNNNTLNGQNTHQFIKINSGHNLTLENITITNYTSGYGGAIYNQGILTVTDATFTNNTANSGGAIYNYYGLLTITNTRFKNNQINKYGGAIYNYNGYLTITNSQFLNNQAFDGIGGAICDDSRNKLTNITSSNFINNTASNGTAITALGWINLTNNTFKQNTATSNKETIDLYGWWNGKHEDNLYESTDVALNEIKLTIKDDQETFQQDEDIILNYTIQLTNPMHYWDFETGINDITLYINSQKNITTKYENTTLNNLQPGKYEIYYTTCNQQSNTVTFKVIGDSQITTPEESYEYYEGINNKIPLHITDPSGQKGTINITIKDQDEYKQLFTYYNIGDGYELPTESLASALKNLYNPLSDSYTINVTYNSDCANPSSTEFTLNITKQRNTTIVYDILNNTEKNVQINITVQDAVYQSPIPDASIQITGDINTDTTSGILTDNTLTPGDYTINVKYPETEDYKASQTTIDFTVEIDKDKKIAELEDKIENLTEKLDEAQQTIETLNNNITNLTTQLANTNNELEQATQEIQNLTQQLETAKDQINNLTTQLEEAQKEIQTLNNTIKELTKPPLNTTITVNPIKSSIGSIAKITAIITDKKGNKVNGGKAIFKINGITLKDKNNNVLYAQVKDGQATLNYKVENVWIKSNTYIEAVYSGTENYTSSRTKQTGILNITKGKANITLDPTTITAKAGQTITLRAKVLDANGDRINNDKIIFKLNGITLKDAQANTIYAQVIDGEAKLVYTLPATYSAKTYTLTAVLGGNYYQRTQNNGTLTIEKKTTTINTENVTSKNNQVTIKATITDENQQPLITTTKLAIKANDITINNNTTSNNGTINITFATTLRPGMYELLIISGENGIYKSAKTTTILKI